ncbi:MAG: archease [Candidatus Poribacteria bacterium]|nr:archease [Candidatus Poribacteria bacterium]
MKTFEYIDHTADLGIRARGKTLEELFTNAAHALFETVAVLDTINPIEQTQIDVEAESVADLMVAWLDELIFRHEVDEVFFKRVELVELSETRLSACAYGEPADFAKHVVYTEIKSVTYHQLSVHQSADGEWTANVIFDL